MKLSLCASCPLGRDGFAPVLAAALAEAGVAAEVALAECLSACTAPSGLAFRAPGKTAYLFADVTPADLPDLITFARLYAESADGNLADARPLGDLRFKARARIPG